MCMRMWCIKSLYIRESEEREVDNYAVIEIDSGEIMDTGYGFIDSKGIEVCTDNELEEV